MSVMFNIRSRYNIQKNEPKFRQNHSSVPASEICALSRKTGWWQLLSAPFPLVTSVTAATLSWVGEERAQPTFSK